MITEDVVAVRAEALAARRARDPCVVDSASDVAPSSGVSGKVWIVGLALGALGLVAYAAWNWL